MKLIQNWSTCCKTEDSVAKGMVRPNGQGMHRVLHNATPVPTYMWSACTYLRGFYRILLRTLLRDLLILQLIAASQHKWKRSMSLCNACQHLLLGRPSCLTSWVGVSRFSAIPPPESTFSSSWKCWHESRRTLFCLCGVECCKAHKAPRIEQEILLDSIRFLVPRSTTHDCGQSMPAGEIRTSSRQMCNTQHHAMRWSSLLAKDCT